MTFKISSQIYGNPWPMGSAGNSEVAHKNLKLNMVCQYFCKRLRVQGEQI
jgi:hypothetical protein